MRTARQLKLPGCSNHSAYKGSVMTENKSTKHRSSFIDLTGKRFGKWTVIAEAPSHPSRNIYWTCLCECGTEKLVAGDKLTGDRSHGCKPCSKRHHGMRYTPEYGSWKAMNGRCNNPNHIAFPYYGGNGKTVCERWKSPKNFSDDMGPKPSAAHSVERIDNSKSYSCGHCEECVSNGWTKNCKWATTEEQARNKRTTRLITFNSETLCALNWSCDVSIIVVQLATIWLYLY